MITILLCFYLSQPQWAAKQTDIFQPLQSSQVAMTQTGHLYLLDSKEARIVHFFQGNKQADIGRKGSGPGEFNVPYAIWTRGSDLIVLDVGASAVCIFDQDGAFKTSHRMLSRSLDFVPVSTGYVYGDWRFSMDPNAPISISWTDLELDRTETLGEWPRGPEANFASAEGGTPKISFNPARDQFQLATSLDGSNFFLALPGRFEIRIFDASGRSIKSAINENRASVPFNESWGKSQLKATNERAQQNPFKVDLEADFPEYFPIVRAIQTTPDNQIGVTFWARDPDQPTYAVYDLAGNPTQSLFAPETWSRVVGLIDDLAYVTVFDTEADEARIAFLPKANVNDFVEANPISEESSANFLMIGG